MFAFVTQNLEVCFYSHLGHIFKIPNNLPQPLTHFRRFRKIYFWKYFSSAYQHPIDEKIVTDIKKLLINLSRFLAATIECKQLPDFFSKILLTKYNFQTIYPVNKW